MMTDQTDSQPRPVTFDLMADDDSYFVLTEALREFASRQRWEAEDDPTGNAESRVRWAGHAEGLLDRIEQALSLQTPQAETSRQQKALDHAREVLAVEETSSSLPDREWRRELRWALRDVVQAFPPPGTGTEPREEPTARLADSPAFNALIAHQLGGVGEGPGDETGTEFDPALAEPEYGEG